MALKLLEHNGKPGGLSPEALAEIPDALRKSLVFGDQDRISKLTARAIGLHDELVGEAADTSKEAISDMMAAVRHAVYSLGLEGGPKAIDQLAHELAGEANTDDILPMRTVVCLSTLATLDEAKLDRDLGPLKARWLKPDKGKALRYMDTATGHAKHLSADAPLDDLMSIVAITEEPEFSTQDVCIKTRRAAQEHLIRRLLTDTPKVIDAGSRLFKYRHFKAILEQMPGSLADGRIGGKSTGVLLAYAGLEQETPDYDDQFASKHGISTDKLHRTMDLGNRLRQNTSRFIGSSIFRQVMDSNDRLANAGTLKINYGQDFDHESAKPIHEEISKVMPTAEFPEHIERQLFILFKELHGQPIAVRSSSLLEDSQEGSFSGQYESIMLANNGNLEQDFEKFKAAILKVYASVFSPDVMAYRKKHKLLYDDEEMGILIQKVNGKKHGNFFFPDVAVVAMSRATQSPGVDSFRGAAKYVGGLGEIAVLSGQGRFSPFAKPELKLTLPNDRSTEESGGGDMRTALSLVQTHMVVINLKTGEQETRNFLDEELDLPRTAPYLWGNCVEQRHGPTDMTCQGIVAATDIPMTLEYIVQKLKFQLGYDVDCEFTVQYDTEYEDWIINLVQCRPQIIPENLKPSRMPKDVPPDLVLIQDEGAVNGTFCKDIDFIIYVDPSILGEHGQIDSGMFAIASYIESVNNRIGQMNREKEIKGSTRRYKYFLIVPGDLGSQNVADGIPVTFGQFSDATGFEELHKQGGQPSFGKHLFGATSESNMASGYKCGLEKGFAKPFFDQAKHSSKFPPVPAGLAHLIKVIDVNQSIKETHGKVKGGWRVHMAQDNFKEPRPMGLYVAPRGKQYPVLVEENGELDEDDEDDEPATGAAA